MSTPKKPAVMTSYVNDNVYTKSFTPREYQVELLDLARERDMLVCLASRVAQNFLCLQIVHSFASQCDKPGVCMCLMDDVQCAKQFVRDVSDFTALIVHHATSPETFPPGVQVVVTCSSILHSWLKDGSISINSLKLLIVDQCHLALQEKSEVSQVMQIVKSSTCLPRIIGLTNSVLEKGRVSAAANLEAQLCQLERSMGCRAEAASDVLSVLRFYPRPHEALIEARSPKLSCPLAVEILYHINEAQNFLSDHRFDLTDVYSDFLDELEEIQDPRTLPLAVLSDLKSVLTSMGTWCADRAALVLLLRVEQLKVKTKYERHYLLLCMMSSILTKIRAICDHEFEQHDEHEKIYKFSSHKVLRLLEVLAQFRDQTAVAKSALEESASSLSKKDKECESSTNKDECTNPIDEQPTNTVPEVTGDVTTDINIKTVIDVSCNGISEDENNKILKAPKIEVKKSVIKCPETDISNDSHAMLQSSLISKSKSIPVLDNNSTPVELEVNDCVNNGTNNGTDDSGISNEIQEHVNHNKDEEISLLNSTIETDTTKQGKKSKKRKKSTHNNPCDNSTVSKETEVNVSLNQEIIVIPKTDLNNHSEEMDIPLLNQTDNVVELNVEEIKSNDSKKDNGETVSTNEKCELKSMKNDTVPQQRPYTRTDRRFHRGSPRKYRRPAPQPTPLQNGELEPLCGMVFVARRFTAQVLYHLLNTIRHVVPDFKSISPQYTASLGEDGEVRDLEKEHRKQEEVLKRFRLRESNLLVCTPMLEEGVELPRCNLVVRFDPPSNFRAMVQSRGRARVNNAHYVTLVEDKDTEAFVLEWSQSLSMEKLLLSRCHNCEPPEEEEHEADAMCHLVEPYCPSGVVGSASVALCGAMALVNRYCAKLPSDTFTRLTPLWRYEEENGMVRCCVRLPINSPLKREIIGPLSSIRAVARRLAALEMCKALYEVRELDAELQPVGKESFLAQEHANLGLQGDEEQHEEEEDQIEGTLEHRPGTTKRRQYYYKKVADSLMECRPEPGQEAYLYQINLRLSCPLPEEQNTRGRKIYPPEESPRGFGILTLKPIPQICPFPIFTRSGEVCVSLELSPKKVILSTEQCEKVVTFLNYTFSSVLRLQKHLMIFGPESAENSYYIVPVTSKPEVAVDWKFVDMIWEQKDFVPSPVPEEERRNFKFDYAKYQDAVVMPWYRNQDQPQYFYVAEICTQLSPKSEFPGGEYHTFEEYYNAKYGLKVQCVSQPLLDVDHTSARLNFLTPRYVNRKGVALPVSSEHTKRNKRENLEQKQILVAELCALHPFPASLWRQAVSLPCILYRINGLLLADELRCKVAYDIGLGMHTLSADFRWPPLDFGWSLAEVLQRSREAISASILAVEEEQKVNKMKIKEIKEGESEEEDEEEKEKKDDDDDGDVEVSKSFLEIGTWSNDMASQGEEWDSLTEEMPEDLPCNVTLLTGNSVIDGPSGSDWGTGIQSHTRVRYGSPTFAPPRKVGNIMENGNCDSYSSFSDDEDDDDDDMSSDLSDEPEFVAEQSSQPVHPDGLRIEFKGDHVAEAFDDQPAFVLPDDIIAEPEDSFPWDWEDLGPNWLEIKKNYEKQVAEHQKCIKNDGRLLHTEQPFVTDRLTHEPNVEASIHRHPLKSTSNVEANQAKTDEIDEKITADNPVVDIATKNLVLSIIGKSDDNNLSVKEESKNVNKKSSTYSGEVIDESKKNVRKENGDTVKSVNAEIDHNCIVKSKEYIESSVESAKLPELESSKKIDICEQAMKSLSIVETIKNDIAKELKEYNARKENVASIVTSTTLNTNAETIDGEKLKKNQDIQVFSQNASEEISSLVVAKKKEILFSFDVQPELDSHPGPSPSIILQALTMSNANDGINLERLETIGDSFLKYAITTYLYCTHENIHEGKLSHLRSKQVSNLQLYRLGRDKQLGRSMIATKFEPHDNWLPPCYFVPWKLEKALIKAGVPPGLWNRQELASLRLMDNETIDKLVWERKNELLAAPAEAQENSEHLLPFVPYNLLTQHSIPDKSLADCVEALIGAYLIACGPRGALLFMSWLGIRVLPLLHKDSNTKHYGWLAPPPSPLLRHIPDPEGELNRMLRGFELFEERLEYRFRDRAYLLQAMSHASYSPNRLTDCYQRLEFLGDAVLDYLITRYLYEDDRQHSPGALTDLRSALVNNAIFAVLAVRHGFHQFFLHLSPGLAQVIQRFVRLQQANSHCLSPQYYVLGDGDVSEAEDIEVPKALGDVFESVAGAIFLDSGMSLDAVWRTYHAMMAPELELFSAHVPKSPIRELLEREPETAKFGKPEKLADGRRVRVSVEVFGQGVFRGIGRNYRIAKSTAAKCALRHLSIRRSTNIDMQRFY